jgi:hypothetical protein
VSHSTQIKIAVCNTEVTYTFGTGTVADNLGVYAILAPKVLTGDDAEQFILKGDPMPEAHVHLLQAELADLVQLYDGDEAYKRQLRVEITRFN